MLLEEIQFDQFLRIAARLQSSQSSQTTTVEKPKASLRGRRAGKPSCVGAQSKAQRRSQVRPVGLAVSGR
jgi:hypothetical protein